ncbi:hypothetical protein BH10PLA2_BH10PLA2_14930 [soil metagenome]
MEEIAKFLQPVTERLPQTWQDYLANGGMPVALGVTTVVVLLLTIGILDLIWIKLFRRRVHKSAAPDLQEDLGQMPPPLQAPGEMQFTIYHVPARIRLIVAAPAGAGREFDEKRVKRELERLWPGVRDVLTVDKPRVRMWPPQLSQQGFALSFHRHLIWPDAQAKASPWTSIAGKIQLEGEALMLGLVLWSPEKTTFGQLTLEPHQWRDVIRLDRRT